MASPEAIMLHTLGISSAMEALSVLSAREQFVIVNRFGLEGDVLTLKEVGQKLGLSAERVRTIEREALKKIGDLVNPLASEPEHSRRPEIAQISADSSEFGISNNGVRANQNAEPGEKTLAPSAINHRRPKTEIEIPESHNGHSADAIAAMRRELEKQDLERSRAREALANMLKLEPKI